MSAEARLRVLAERWAEAKPGERANFQMYVTELAAALGVQGPLPRGSGYEFELPVRVVNRDGTETTQFADLSKQECFLLEAKDEVQGVWNEKLMRAAYGQALGYVNHLPDGAPPYILVLDVASTVMVWDGWSGYHGGFNAGERIDLPTLDQRPEDITLLRDIWENPSLRDPRGKAEAVTTEIAEKLAGLASSLENRGHDQEEVARFLMRCVFTMFSEDVGLLEGEPFLKAIRDIALPNPPAFQGTITDLWAAMDQGKDFHHRKLLQFNGHFFRDHKVLPLDKADLQVLLEAAEADWRQVEPSIFGTLLTRALDPVERHRLGAEFTPRIHVERVVRPTVETPIRDRWKLVEMEVFQLQEAGKDKQALKKLREFHSWLRSLRFLDPACGSGNFLYVTLEIVKLIEAEVIRAEEDITGHPDLKLQEVGPWQFHGLEIKPWAREIAELTLWIGYHQFWKKHHEGVRPPEPVLMDTGTLERRDAVLAWDEVVEDPDRARPDPTPRLQHPVTGDMVPDPRETISYDEYKGSRQADWPEADFIIGNPPFMGNKRMREGFGDGYVDALRAAYPEVSESADYVMYWWYRAAEAVADGRTLRAGLITTNSITQTLNRTVVEKAMERDVGIVWAIPTHPWVDDIDSAAVRVAMTVMAKAPDRVVLVNVDEDGAILTKLETDHLNSDLSAHANVALASRQPLLANRAMSLRGFTLVGRGFVLDASEAEKLIKSDRRAEVVRPYVNGRDLTAHARGVWVIDFGMRSETEARDYPVLYDIIRDRVKPQRDANNRESYRRLWWRFGEPRPSLREALEDLPRFIGTPYVSKHRVFQFLESEVAPDEKVVCIALSDPYHLGILSSKAHASWALAAGARLGIGNDPTYNNSLCFESFPFPDSGSVDRARVEKLSDEIHRHRKEAIANQSVTITGLYNVLDKLRSGEALSHTEKETHVVSACGILRDLHDELDDAVASCYGWPWPLSPDEILVRLVELHDQRIAEEESGRIRWLRPDYQTPRFGEAAGEAPELKLADKIVEADKTMLQWPTKTIDQIAAIQESLLEAPGNLEGVARRFRGTRRTVARRHLETLVMMGEVRQLKDGSYHAVSTDVE